MTSSDPKQGGDLFDMAKDGTSIPGDAGKQNLIPSVPRPDQMTDNNNFGDNLGASDLAGAADNATDIPRVRLMTLFSPLYFMISLSRGLVAAASDGSTMTRDWKAQSFVLTILAPSIRAMQTLA